VDWRPCRSWSLRHAASANKAFDGVTSRERRGEGVGREDEASGRET
jgi:hypothetical protein